VIRVLFMSGRFRFRVEKVLMSPKLTPRKPLLRQFGQEPIKA
jgi:hypothetical protein